MTARQVFEATLIELNKINAPTLKLYEFNYLFNKAINQYINKIYTMYDLNQQTTDDLRVLKSSAFLTPIKTTYNQDSVLQSKRNATYEIAMPTDYLHMLNCTCIYKMAKTISCYNQGDYIEIPALRLTADSWSQIVTDVYNRPSPMRPYYYIHNVNTQVEEPTNLYNSNNIFGTDQHASGRKFVACPLDIEVELQDGIIIPKSDVTSLYKVLSEKLSELEINTNNIRTEYPIYYSEGNRHLYFKINNINYYIWIHVDDFTNIKILTSQENPQNPGNTIGLENKFAALQILQHGALANTFPNKFTLQLPDGVKNASSIEKPAYVRHSNPTKVRCEIRYGKDDTIYQLVQVNVDYVKSPQHIRLTQEQIDLTEDTSQIMEFPDYVNQEIINELVHLVMERSSDPRLATNMQISQSIARPTQQQQQTN